MLATGIAAESFIWRGGQSPQYVVYDLGIGFLTVFVVLVVWEAKPRNLVGPLLFVWAAWFVLSPVRYAHIPWVVGVSWLVDGAVIVCFGWAMLGYPSGRLPGVLDRSLVVFAFLSITVLHGLQLLWAPIGDLFGGDLSGCQVGCLSKPPFLGLDSPIAHQLRTIGDGLAVVLGLLFVALVGRRLARASARERRILLPVGIVAVLTVTKAVAEQFFPSHAGGAWDAPDIVDHVTTLGVAVAFLLGTYASRVDRAHVADLLARLGGAKPNELQPMLAQVLRDPDLTLVLGPPDHQPIPALGAHQVSTPIYGESEQVLARLGHDRSVLDDRRLLSSVMAATRLALENADLQARLSVQLNEVRESRARLVQASDTERRRLERNLHDGAQQRLLALGLALQLAQQASAAHEIELQHLLKEAQAELGAAIEDLRELARGINPAVLTDRGLAPAVHTLANRCPVPVEVRSLPAQRLPPEVETTAYYVISEALQNAAKHSQAGSVFVCVDASPGQLRIEVGDDGIGGATVPPDGGLGGLRDRVEAVHGHLALNSPVGKGTRLVVELPCGSS
jgi:signal transduction histidine kinase